MSPACAESSTADPEGAACRPVPVVVGGMPTVVCGEMEVTGLSLSKGMELMVEKIREAAYAQAYAARD
ncbi:MAG: hypothetical protein QOJ56_3814 [Mycobacterium sp.]|jgi:hypothetical protein|nr:hypothetical protein [Mycobacterium sp.]MDT5355282.1 hypothetical protein [Mycobacterium sp.]MDT7719080.1 hypothetical protein [Mycobacterium sp.]